MSEQTQGGVDGDGLSRRQVVRGAAGMAALAVLGISGGLRRASAAEGQTVGIGEAGGIAIEFVGAIHQKGFDFTVYGFITAISGMDPNYLFTTDDAANRTVGSAQFLLYGTAKAHSRAVVEPLFVIDAAGELALNHWEGGGASFDDPASFGKGKQVATLGLVVQNIVNVTGPQSGLCTGSGDVSFVETKTFAADGDAFVIGRTGALAELTYSGQGSLLDPTLPEALLTIAGNFRF